MANGTNNPNEIADGALFFLRDSAGFRQLFQVESAEDTSEGSVSTVTGPAGVVGTVRAAGGFSLSLTTRRARGVPDEADWEGLEADDEIFRFEIQILGGPRRQYSRCRVSNANTSYGNDGSVTTSVTIVAPARDIIKG